MTLQENGELSEVDLKEIDTIFITRQTLHKKYHAYMIGQNYEIMNKTKQKEPDNRVPVSFGRKIVKTLKGYMGKVGYITYKSENDKYQKYLKTEIFDKNNEQLLTAELLEAAMGYARAFELLIVDEDLGIRQYRIPSDQGLMIYDDTLEHREIAFIYQIIKKEVEGSRKVDYYYRTIYYKEVIVYYKRKGLRGVWEKIEDDKSHPFGDVPAIEYMANNEGIPVYYPVLPIIDEHDKIISSDYANEMERFANAYLLLLKRINTTLDDDGKSDLDKIKELRMFEGLGESENITNVNQAVAFLTKPSKGDDIKEAADRFERLIYDMSMVINPNDDEFQTASGIALKYKLLPMEWHAADIEAYFSRGLQRRLNLLNAASAELSNTAGDTVTINFRRDIPVDIDALATQANALVGILSDETILNLFPANIVPDVQAELARLNDNIGRIDDSTDPNQSN